MNELSKWSFFSTLNLVGAVQKLSNHREGRGGGGFGGAQWRRVLNS